VPAGNPVGKLQEMTQKKYMAPPAYEFQDDGRPPHEREYTCTVKLLQYTNTGNGFQTPLRASQLKLASKLHTCTLFV